MKISTKTSPMTPFHTFEYEGQQIRVFKMDGKFFFAGMDVWHASGGRAEGNSARSYEKLSNRNKRVIAIEGENRVSRLLVVSMSGADAILRDSRRYEAIPLRKFLKREVFPILRGELPAVSKKHEVMPLELREEPEVLEPEVMELEAPKPISQPRPTMPDVPIMPKTEAPLAVPAAPEPHHAMNTFQFESHAIRTIQGQDGEPWFVASDVADVLDYSDAEAMTRKLDADEKQNLQIVGFGPRGASIINESGLYSAILRSTKPEAKRFKKWVTSEVLPSIRKTGGYQVQQFEVPKTYADALMLAAKQVQELECKNQVIAVLEPKAQFHDSVANSEGCQTFDEVAKIFGTGRIRLFEALRRMNIIMPESTLPYQTYVNNGYFNVIPKIRYGQSGEAIPYTQTMITGKGMIEIEKRLRANGLLVGNRFIGFSA